MELWVIFAIAAAAAQSLRFMAQKQLTLDGLTAAGATYARFFYSAPVVLVGMLVFLFSQGIALPATSARFWTFAALGGVAQILATVAVVALFQLRAFAVGITFKKSEVILTALVGVAVLGDAISGLGWLALGVGLAGVLLLSDPPRSDTPGAGRFFNRAAGLGLLSGVFFAVSAVAYRAATLEIGGGSLIVKAGWTLAMASMLQLVIMSGWLAWRDPAQIGVVARNWRRAGLVGLFSMIGSYCWFAAFSLQNAAYVFAVGQIELVFSLLASWFVFGERISSRELAGIAVLGVSIVSIALIG